MADIVQWHATQLMEWGVKGAFHELTNLLPQRIWDDMYPLAISGVEDPEGNRWSAPWQWENTGLFAHRDLVEEAGMWIPTAEQVAKGKGWSWDEFLTAAKKMTKDFDGDGVPDRWGFSQRLDSMVLKESMLPWFWEQECEVLFEKDGEWVVEFGEGGRKALKFVYDLINTHKVMSEDCFGIDSTAQRSAFEGKIKAMYTDGCWGRRMLMREAPDVDFVYMPLPVGKVMVSSAEVQGLAINKNTKHLQEALEVLEFLLSPHVSATQAWGDCLLTTRISGMNYLCQKSPRESWDVVNAYQRWSKPWPSHPAWETFYNLSFVPNIQGYLMKEISLEEAIEIMEEEGNEFIAEYE